MTIYPITSLRTEFSTGESVIKAKEVAELAQAVNTDKVIVTDTMSVSSMVTASKSAKDTGVEILYGARLRMAVTPKAREFTYITVYPVNEAGMKTLFQLISRGFEEQNFYYVPMIFWSDLADWKNEFKNLIVTFGDAESIVFGDGNSPGIELAQLLTIYKWHSIYATIIPYNTPYWHSHNVRSIEIAENLRDKGIDVRYLATAPTLTKPDNEDVLTFVASIAHKRYFRDYLKPANTFAPLDKKSFVRALVEGRTALEKLGVKGVKAVLAEAVANTSVLVDTIEYRWKPLEPSLPILAEDPVEAVKQACHAGFKKRFNREVFGYKPSREELKEKYLPRLKYELETLERLGFCSYFLLVADLVVWAKKQGILVGPGRGSAGGSLVSYLMGITDIDPIRFNLLFERFINPDRLDLPDIDIDFMSERRGEVIEYLINKYGSSHVAAISNYNTMAERSAVKDVGKVLGIEPGELEVIKYLPAEHGQPVSLEEGAEQVPEIHALKNNYPEMWKAANEVCGMIKSYSQHAAGVIVAGEPLLNRAVVETRKDQVVCWDKKTCEEMGLIKLDVLGLSTLDLIDRAVKLVKERHGVDIDFMSLPLDDEKTLELFSSGRTFGVFQFDGGSVRKLLKRMAEGGTLTFDDLVAANALNRPGPLEAGMVDDYVRRRNGDEMVFYPHPLMEDALASTYGVIAYQEQLMQISRDLCGFTGGEADVLRSAVGKKNQELMDTMKEKFISGAKDETLEIELENGTKKMVKKSQKFKVIGEEKYVTVEEAIASDLDIEI